MTPTSVRNQFTTSDGVRIAYEALGSGNPAIICHGGPSTTHEYLVGDLAPLVEQLTLVFHDYRGSGASDVAPTESYTFERLADDVDELRRHLGFERVSILAHSMGGFVALQFALRHADRCRSLALMDCSPSGAMGRMALPTLRALGGIRAARLLMRAVWYGLAWSWRRESETRTRARYSIMGIMQEGRREFRAAVREREILADNDNAKTLEQAAFRIDLVSQLEDIACPVLVIHGGNDAPFVAGGRLLERGLPVVRRAELPGVGHHPLVEENERTTQELIDFLAAH